MSKFSEILKGDAVLWHPLSYQTLGIPRSQMPQVAGEYVKDFLKWSGYKFKEVGNVNCRTLKASQRDFNMEKVSGMMADPRIGEKPIMVSKDGYVVDGHHRWLAALNSRKPINVYRIEANVHDILRKIEGYPKVFSKNINEGKLFR